MQRTESQLRIAIIVAAHTLSTSRCEVERSSARAATISAARELAALVGQAEATRAIAGIYRAAMTWRRSEAVTL